MTVNHYTLLSDIVSTFNHNIPSDWKMSAQETSAMYQLFKDLEKLVYDTGGHPYPWKETFESTSNNILNIHSFYDSKCCQYLESNQTLPIHSFVNGYITKKILNCRRSLDIESEKPENECNIAKANKYFNEILQCTKDSSDIFSSLLSIEHKLANSFISNNESIDQNEMQPLLPSIEVYDPVFNRNLSFNPSVLLKDTSLLFKFSHSFYHILKSTYYADIIKPNHKIRIKSIDTIISASCTSNNLTNVFGMLLKKANVEKKIILCPSNDNEHNLALAEGVKNLLVVDTILESGKHIQAIQSSVENDSSKQFIGAICIFYNDMILPNKRDDKDVKFIHEMIENDKLIYLFDISSFLTSFLVAEAEEKVKVVLKEHKEQFLKTKCITNFGMGLKYLKDILPDNSPLKNKSIPCISIGVIDDNNKKELEAITRDIGKEEDVLIDIFVTGPFEKIDEYKAVSEKD